MTREPGPEQGGAAESQPTGVALLLDRCARWLAGTGPENDIVMSSRVRLARNLADLPFPGRASAEQQQSVLDQVLPVLRRLSCMSGALVCEMPRLSGVERQLLVERHLISREHAARNQGSGVGIAADEQFTVMVNEEDHLRVQCLESGLDLYRAWDGVDRLDSELNQCLEFGFSARLGYLTACPTNVGTGMRASVMAHLPGMVLEEQASRLINSVAKMGLAVRGIYGEGTEALGNLFQISNQRTLGESETEILGRLDATIREVIDKERCARLTLVEKKPHVVYDQIGRSLGTLANAYVLSSKEAMNLLSSLRLGVDLGLVRGVDRNVVSRLFAAVQPGHLQRRAAGRKSLSAGQRDVRRAQIAREELAGCRWLLEGAPGRQ